ncbi:MAG: hypothetical protein HQM10_02675 [Candidatus Riflebacteria bacterium]|nr:hypothetical protein [Candidatus Riflebacteria bacterium]
MKRLIIMGLSFIFISGCTLFDSSTANGLKNYFLDAIKPHGIKVDEIACKVSPPGTRSAYYHFKISPAEFAKMKTALKLKKEELYDPVTKEITNFSLLTFHFSRAKEVENFAFQNPKFVPEDFDTHKESPLLSGVDIYVAEPPLKPMSGNSRSSFSFLIYNSSSNQACAFLEYPYG